jgi:16S rRNA (guanine527-N7)-methyltransferase
MRDLEPMLRQGLRDLALPLRDVQVTQLLSYLGLIQKWSKVYNLTAVRDPVEMLTHHLMDSLAVIEPLRRQIENIQTAWQELRHASANESSAPQSCSEHLIKLLDVGSGAGLPGVVIAICLPQVRVDCVDAVAKKAAFVQQVAFTLKLPNLHGLHARVESLKDEYSVIASRAFASLADFVGLSSAALAGQGAWLAMKGKYPIDEIATLSAGVRVFHVEQLSVPGLGAERCIVWMRKI